MGLSLLFIHWQCLIAWQQDLHLFIRNEACTQLYIFTIEGQLDRVVGYHNGDYSLLIQLLFMYYSHAVVDVVILLSLYYFIERVLYFFKVSVKTLFYMTLININ